MLGLFIALGVVGLLLLVLLGILIGIYIRSFYSPFKWQNDDFALTPATSETCDANEVNFMIQRTRDMLYEDVYIKSFDKTKLHARMYTNNSSDTVAILAHGYRGTACRDFSGGAYDMIQKGFNVLLIDERAHGLSGGHTITFGSKESRDVKCWIDFAKNKFGEDKRIVLIGISMGGATVLTASDYLSKKDKVIADSPYSSTKDILQETLKKMKLNPKLVYPFVRLSAILFAHFDPNKLDVNNNVKNSAAKFLIIHGDNDSMVPHKFSQRVYEANEEKVTYVIFPGAEHGLSYIVDKNRYQRVVNDFLDNE